MSNKVIIDVIHLTITEYGKILNQNMYEKGYTWILCDTTNLVLEQTEIGMKTIINIDGENKECYIKQNDGFNEGYRASDNKLKFCNYIRSVLKMNNNIQSRLINNDTQYIIVFDESDSFNYDYNELSLEEIKGFINGSLLHYIKCIKEAIKNGYKVCSISIGASVTHNFTIQNYRYYVMADDALGVPNTIVEVILKNNTNENKALLNDIFSKNNLTAEWHEWILYNLIIIKSNI